MAVNLLSPIPSAVEKTAGDAVSVYSLSGKLYLSDNGHLMLSVPNALVRGVFDALHEPGIELPPGKGGSQFNAHISVAHREELAAAGIDAGKVSERGHSFRYNLGRLKTAQPTGWAEMSRVWFLEVKSPELEQLRKSYGLSAKPRNNDHEFHVTVAVRRRRVLLAGDVVKRSENFHEKTNNDGLPTRGESPGTFVENAGEGRLRESAEKTADLVADIVAAGKLTDVNPTPAQQESGNYRKGKVKLHGLTVAIENPKGSTRSGTSRSGKAWSIAMKSAYGYILGTEDKSNDADHVDVFIGDQPESEIVFVVNQIDPETKKFDEVKVMLGFTTEASAREGYLANYDKNWQGLESVRAMTMSQFKEWLADAGTKKARTSRHDRDAGVQNLAADDFEMRVPGRSELSSVRCEGNSSLQKMAEFVLSLLPGPGAAAGKFDAGASKHERQLLSGQLSLGDSAGAMSKSSYQRANNVQRSDDGTDGLGKTLRDQIYDSPGKAAAWGAHATGSGGDGYAAIPETHNDRNKVADHSAVDGRAGDQPSRVGTQVAPRMAGGENFEYGAVKLAELSKLAANIFQRSMIAQLNSPHWDPRRGVVSNLTNNLRQVRSRGQAMVQQADFAESLRGTINPEYAWQRLQDQLAGRYESEITPTERLMFDTPVS